MEWYYYAAAYLAAALFTAGLLGGAAREGDGASVLVGAIAWPLTLPILAGVILASCLRRNR